MSWWFSFIIVSSTCSLRKLLRAFHPAPCNSRIVTKCFITPNFTQPDIGSMFLQSIFTCLSDHSTVSLTMWQHWICSLPLNIKPHIKCNFQNGDLHTEFWWKRLRETDRLGDLGVDGKIILKTGYWIEHGVWTKFMWFGPGEIIQILSKHP